MAITTPAVAANDLVQASWGNAVRADLLALDSKIFNRLSIITAADVGDVDSNATAWGDWVTVGNVSVPAWANAAVVDIRVTGAISVTSGYLGNVRINFAASAGLYTSYVDQNTTTGSHIVLSDYFTGLTPGASVTVKVQAIRTAGTGTIRLLGNAGRRTAMVHWLYA